MVGYMKFKVGDNVVVIGGEDYDEYCFKNNRHNITGKNAKVRDVHEDSKYPYILKLGEYEESGFREDELDYARYRYTRLAEKMFPEGHREGDWWILK